MLELRWINISGRLKWCIILLTTDPFMSDLYRHFEYLWVWSICPELGWFPIKWPVHLEPVSIVANGLVPTVIAAAAALWRAQWARRHNFNGNLKKVNKQGVYSLDQGSAHAQTCRHPTVCSKSVTHHITFKLF